MPHNMKNPQIFIVDDDHYYNQLVVQMVKHSAIKDHPLDIHSFENSQACLKDDHKPDLVFLDFYLSTENDITQTGFDTLKKLKEQYPKSTIIFMSKNHDWAKFKKELQAEGAADFIKKDEHMKQNIENILRSHLNTLSTL